MNHNIKLTKKEIEELSNKLHYDGELLKIKKKAVINEELANAPDISNYSKDILSHSSIIILIKKILYEYGTSVKKNAYADYTKNPKLNYEQYIDIFKDLYYLPMDAPPEDYLDEDSIYKELWNKLIIFSSGPENSIESNVFLLYLLELNGFFSNEKIIKVLTNEIYWIKLEEYDDLIANERYIQDNWDDLKMAKIENIKKLKLEGKYNPIHCEELYNIIIYNENSKLNPNISNISTNHYITTFKGNSNYYMTHGYNSKNKYSEETFLRFSNSLNKSEENKHNSITISNNSNKKMKNFKNRVPLKDSYNDLLIKRKNEIENKKKDEEKKLKEICTFKPNIINMNKNVFSNMVKVELPKHKKNKSVNLYNNSNTQENTSINNLNTLNKSNLTVSNQIESDNNNYNREYIKAKNLKKYNNHNYLSVKDLKTDNNNTRNNSSQSPILRNSKKNIYQNSLKRNKSSLQKMFEDNPLKNDRAFNIKIQQLKMGKDGKELENYNNNLVTPMRFDIEYANKFNGLGININKEANMRQKTQNVIFYNIKINDKIKTLKYIEGDNLKLNVINFVRKNKLPEDVINIILTKIKEKTIEENFKV